MGLKLKLFFFSLDCITKEVMERKHKMLKKRLVRATVLAAGIAAIPLPGVDVPVNIALLVHEVSYYMRIFRVERESVYSLRDFDHSLLKCRYLLERNFNLILFIGKKKLNLCCNCVRPIFVKFDYSNTWICHIFSYYCCIDLHIS